MRRAASEDRSIAPLLSNSFLTHRFAPVRFFYEYHSWLTNEEAGSKTIVINKKVWQRSANKFATNDAFLAHSSLWYASGPGVVAFKNKAESSFCKTIWAKKSLATTYSPTENCSTIGANELNFRVRDGNGCDLIAVITRHYLHFSSQSILKPSAMFDLCIDALVARLHDRNIKKG